MSTKSHQTPIGTMVDLDFYPLHQPDSPQLRRSIEQARTELRTKGCAVVRRFLLPKGIAVLANEIDHAKPATHYSTQRINPYFHTHPDTSLPDRHPVNTFAERSSGFIPGDAWESGGPMDSLFRCPELAAFLAECLEVDGLHCYSDPLAGLTANVLDAGQQFPWHFDTNEFAVTVLVDEPDGGGLFQYAPQIRTPDDERFEALQSVLDGDHRHVTTLQLQPGDLQIFRGRHSVHRVTRVAPGSRPRHAAILAFTAQPGVIGRADRTRQLFGRVMAEHDAAEQLRVRADSLLD